MTAKAAMPALTAAATALETAAIAAAMASCSEVTRERRRSARKHARLLASTRASRVGPALALDPASGLFFGQRHLLPGGPEHKHVAPRPRHEPEDREDDEP